MNKGYIYIILVFSLITLSSCSFVKDLTKRETQEEVWNIEWDSESEGKPIKYRKDANKEKKNIRVPKTELTEYCKSWIGTPHVMGGMTRSGVDCSGFVGSVYKDVYGISLPRNSGDIEKVVDPIDDKSKLKEGDLVFFNGRSGKVNHVGIYIKDDTFVHASSSKGVMISNLNEKYWIKIYRRGGRHPEIKDKKDKKA
ncbi:MAG: NlpC/P60 family protein [Bacteroidales bacterium]|nr:NlpC/P60 family protein [Bacteroidales bacterium]